MPPKAPKLVPVGSSWGPGAGLQQPGECIDSADRPSIAVMRWDWAARMMLTLWFWGVLTHLDMEWIQGPWLPTAHSQPLSLSFMCGLLQIHSQITLPLWWPLWATAPKVAGVIYPMQITPTPLLLAPRAVALSLHSFCTTWNEVLRGGLTHLLQGLSSLLLCDINGPFQSMSSLPSNWCGDCAALG